MLSTGRVLNCQKKICQNRSLVYIHYFHSTMNLYLWNILKVIFNIRWATKAFNFTYWSSLFNNIIFKYFMDPQFIAYPFPNFRCCSVEYNVYLICAGWVSKNFIKIHGILYDKSIFLEQMILHAKNIQLLFKMITTCIH